MKQGKCPVNGRENLACVYSKHKYLVGYPHFLNFIALNQRAAIFLLLSVSTIFMAMTNAEATGLINIEKKVEAHGTLIERLPISGTASIKGRFDLASVDGEHIFILDVEQSKKNLLKITLYLMEGDTRTGLMRLDFSGQHQNPLTISSSVPAIFHPHIGRWFSYSDHHLHMYVEGYKTTLDWAIPLTDDSFSIKEITGQQDIINSFIEFCSRIRLTTRFDFNSLAL